MLSYLRYRYAKARMVAFVNGELPVKTRRFIARLIDEDRRVYHEYIRQRQTMNELERTLPAFGRPEAQQLDTLWANIQAQMTTGDAGDNPPPTLSRYPVGYGLAMILCVVALLMPLAFHSSRTSAAILPQQPQPELAATRTRPAHDTPPAEPTAVAYVLQTQSQATENRVSKLDNTPAPRTPG